MDWLLCGIGLVILLAAGDCLVKGAVNLSLRIGIPALIVSLTIVAFGTSAPELLIAINATLSGSSGIAIGNIVGSNTANILLVLGIPALFKPLDTSNFDIKPTYYFMMVASIVFIALACTGGFEIWQGSILLLMLSAFLLKNLKDASAQRNRDSRPFGSSAMDLDGADASIAGWKIVGFLILGLAGLPLGADILVDSASSIARSFAITEAVVGLTLIAIGTSLPELATAIVSIFRNQAGVALGNVIGSNIFNLLGIIGVTAMIDYVAVDPSFLRFDFWVMLAASTLLAPFVLLGWRLTRIWGFALTTGYLLYVVFVLG